MATPPDLPRTHFVTRPQAGSSGLEMLLVLGLLAAICVLVPWLLVLFILPASWWLGRGLQHTLRGGT